MRRNDEALEAPQWFALHVRSRREKSVAVQLEAKEQEAFLPVYNARRRWTDRMITVSLPLFSGYVFCRFRPEYRSSVMATSGVIDVVRNGRDLAPIHLDEIEALRRAVNTALFTEPYASLVPGQTVVMSDGPLRGLSGKLLEVRGGLRLVLSVHMLQRSVLVEINRDWVVPEPQLVLATSPSGFCGSLPATFAATPLLHVSPP